MSLLALCVLKLDTWFVVSSNKFLLEPLFFIMETLFQHFCTTVSCLPYYLLFGFEWNTIIVISKKVNNIVIVV